MFYKPFVKAAKTGSDPFFEGDVAWVGSPLAPEDLAPPIGPYTSPLTFAVSPPGGGAWVLTHPRNLISRSTTGWICADARELQGDR